MWDQLLQHGLPIAVNAATSLYNGYADRQQKAQMAQRGYAGGSGNFQPQYQPPMNTGGQQPPQYPQNNNGGGGPNGQFPSQVGGRNLQMVPTGYDQNQMTALQNILRSGQNNMNNPYAGFEGIRKDAERTFFEDIIPQIESNFNLSGSNHASSGVLQAQKYGGAATLASRLAALQSDYGQRQQDFGLRQSQLGLNKQYEPYLEPTWGETLAENFGGPVGKGITEASIAALIKWLSGKNEEETDESGGSNIDPHTAAKIMAFIKRLQGQGA